MKIIFCLALLICFATEKVFANGIKVMESVQKSIVYISSESGYKKMTGSGVIVMQDEVLTNCHVVEDAEEIIVQFYDGVKTPASIKGKIGNLDMCALTAITNKRPKVPIAPISDVKIGQPIYAIGNPLGLKFSISDGVVSSLRDSSPNKLIQITAPISSGSSGGGVFNTKGKLLGITTFTLSEGQNLNFAIPASYRNTIEILPIDKGMDQVAKAERVTFKGIPFGSNIEQFKRVFPDVVCKQFGLEEAPLGKICSGAGINYLDRTASEFIAIFESNKFEHVKVFFDSSSDFEPSKLEDTITQKVSEYFGQGSTYFTNSEGKEILTDGLTTWSIKNQQGEFSISVIRCDTEHFLSYCKAPGAVVDIQREKIKNNQDF